MRPPDSSDRFSDRTTSWFLNAGMRQTDVWEVTVRLSALLSAGIAPWVLAGGAALGSWKVGALGAVITAARSATVRYVRIRQR